MTGPAPSCPALTMCSMKSEDRGGHILLSHCSPETPAPRRGEVCYISVVLRSTQGRQAGQEGTRQGRSPRRHKKDRQAPHAVSLCPTPSAPQFPAIILKMLTFMIVRVHTGQQGWVCAHILFIGKTVCFSNTETRKLIVSQLHGPLGKAS